PRLVDPNPIAQVQTPSPFVLPPQLPLPAKNPLLFDPFLSVQLESVPTQTPPPEARPSIYRMWLDEDVAYIITAEESVAFLSLTSDDDREQFVEQFWQRRDKKEHYQIG